MNGLLRKVRGKGGVEGEEARRGRGGRGWTVPTNEELKWQGEKWIRPWLQGQRTLKTLLAGGTSSSSHSGMGVSL